MAIGAGVVWEIRTTATAGNVNSGGFDPTSAGTDYSQQDASQYNATDLASTNGNTNPAVITSASHSFVTADEGNIINITAGTSWTVGRYKIVSTSGGAATLDRAVGTTATISGGTYRVGGALSLGNANDTTTLAAVAASNKIWIKSGTYTLGATLSGLVAGGTNGHTLLTGYTSSRSDSCLGVNRPILNLNTSANALPNNWRLSNLDMRLSSANNISVGTSVNFFNCRVLNSASSGCLSGSTGLKFINSEAYCNRSTCIIGTSGLFVFGSYIHGGTIGISTSALGMIVNSVFLSCATAISGDAVAIGNTIYGSERKYGTGVSTSTGLVPVALNNILYGLVTGITSATANQTGYENYNDYFNNTTDATNYIKGPNSIAINPGFTNMGEIVGTTATLSALVLTDSSANFTGVTDERDYVRILSGTGATAGYYRITAHTLTTLTLEVTAGTNATADKAYQITVGRVFSIGTNLKAKGFPGTFPNCASTIAYTDIGAVQRQEPVATIINTIAKTFIGG